MNTPLFGISHSSSGQAGLLIRLEQADIQADLQAVDKELIVKIKGHEYLSLCRAFTVRIHSLRGND